MKLTIAKKIAVYKLLLLRTCVLIFLTACQINLFAQTSTTTIKGRVVGENNQPLEGATVTEKGRNNTTSSATNGTFRINVQNKNATLLITYIGYESRSFDLKGISDDITIQLGKSNRANDSVIVVGYGTQRKALSTAAVSAVKGAELSKVPAANISNSLAGRTAGVITRSTGGRPGADNQNIFIRGVSTTGRANPLVVVDGVIRDNINEVDPNNIETVTVLKDAAAVAPYGLGGANGVILITTKRGTSGAPTISIGGYYGDQQPTYLPKMLNYIDYMKLRQETDLLTGPTKFTDAYINSYLDMHNRYPDSIGLSDPINTIVRKHAPIKQANVQVRGGNQTVRYYAGISYFDQEGMFPTSTYNRYNYNINLDVNVTPITVASFSINGATQTTSDIDGGTSQMFRSVYKFLPIANLSFSNGLPGESSGNTPMGVLASTGYNRRVTTNMLTTIAIDQKIPFIQGLSLKGTVNYDPYNYVNKQWHQPFVFYAYTNSLNGGTYSRGISGQENSTQTFSFLQQDYWQQNTLTLQGYLNYHNTFGKHDFTGLAVVEKRSAKQFNFNGRRNNFGLNIDELSLGSSNRNDYDNGGASNRSSQVGYVYRASYAYDRRFLAEASGRYDGHYFFAPGRRWTFLPSFALGWVMSNEKFLQPVKFINTLKLRGSWGKSGNLASSPNGNAPAAFQWLSAYTLRGNAYSFGDGTLVQGSYVDLEANPNITWEKANKTDIGIEATLWNGLLRLEADYFYEKRSDMLLSPDVIVPQEYGLTIAQQNVGILQNRGFEITLGTTKQFSNGLRLSVDGNFTYAKNKLVQIYENKTTLNDPGRSRTGRRLGQVFGYKSAGLFSTADDKNGDGIINTADGYTVTQFGTLRPGDIRYEDVSGPAGKPDGVINSFDERAIGSPQTPAIVYGINLNASWKGFDLTGFFQGAAISNYNVYGFMTVANLNNNSNSSYEYYNNRWTPNNQNSKYPRSYAAPTSNNGQTSDFWLINSSYLRLKTASLGYTIPARISSKIKMKNLRVYVTGQNMFTLSQLKFTDPETTGEQGYPIQKVFMAGFNVTF